MLKYLDISIFLRTFGGSDCEHEKTEYKAGWSTLAPVSVSGFNITIKSNQQCKDK